MVHDRSVPATDGKFAALHGAFWRGGVLYVPKGVKAAAPAQCVVVSQWQDVYAYAGRSGRRSEATFIDEYGSPNLVPDALHVGAIELLVRDNASLMYAGLQDFGTNMWQFNHERGRVGRDARLDWVTSAMDTLAQSIQTVELDGQGSWARMSGLFFADGRQHFDLDTQQNHNAPDTVGDLL